MQIINGLISIIIPCYNGAGTLARCLDSVFTQTYQRFEIIVINDGSRDESAQILQAYAARDSRLRILENPTNYGVSAARNSGMKAAKGEFLQFLDADDEMLPAMLQTLHDLIVRENADIAACNFKGNPLFYTDFASKTFDLRKKDDLLEYYQHTFLALLPWNKLYRRSAVDATFDTDVRFAEDELFNVAVLSRVRKIACVNEKLYFYHFAPADEAARPHAKDGIAAKSCLNKILDSGANTRGGIWYRGSELVPKRRALLEGLLQNGELGFTQVDELLYTRVFDFLFWELSALLYMRPERFSLYREVYCILREPLFVHSVEVQKGAGFALRRVSAYEQKQLCRTFVDLCVTAYDEITGGQQPLSFYDVALLLFHGLFCAETEPFSHGYNYLRTLLDDASPEKAYAAHLLGSGSTARWEAAGV